MSVGARFCLKNVFCDAEANFIKLETWDNFFKFIFTRFIEQNRRCYDLNVGIWDVYSFNNKYL